MRRLFLGRFFKLLLVFLAVVRSPCFGQANAIAVPALKVPVAYREAMSQLMLSEANEYARALGLPETLPLTTNLLIECYVTPAFVAERYGALGSLRTTNYSYAFGKGKRLSYINRLIKSDNPYDYDSHKRYAIDPPAMNTNAAYQQATQWLAKAFVDVKRLSESSTVSVRPWVILNMTTKKYSVEWQRNGEPAATVVLVEPGAELWTLRVENPQFILRKPLEIANLDFLLSQTNAPPLTNAPGSK